MLACGAVLRGLGLGCRQAAPRLRPLEAAAAGAGRAMSSGWGPHGVYGGPSVDPTHGRSRWHRLDQSWWKQQEKPVLGAINDKEYDEKYGRWWFARKEDERPKLYTTIGKHARRKGLKRTIVRWLYSSPNFKKLRRDPYRKRWPKLSQIGAGFFAEFCQKDFQKRTLAETAHTLPLYGVGCKFWRAPHSSAEETRGQFFVPDSAHYSLRPIIGTLRGTQYMAGRPVRKSVAAIAKSLGSWRYELPETRHPLVYRPPFPPTLAERAAAAAAEAEAEGAE